MSELEIAVKFVGHISKMGNDLIIWIPRDFQAEARKLKDKQVKVEITSAI